MKKETTVSLRLDRPTAERWHKFSCESKNLSSFIFKSVEAAIKFRALLEKAKKLCTLYQKSELTVTLKGKQQDG